MGSTGLGKAIPVRVRVGGEFSGIVRDAFLALGHEAESVDLLASERPGPHRQQDLTGILNDGWADLLIFHPPCDYLAKSGVQWLHHTPPHPSPGVLYGVARWLALFDAAAFFMAGRRACVPRIAVENPIPHKYARALIGPYSQVIQPNQFGCGETKATCLWLKGLPPLEPTACVPGRHGRVWREAQGPERKKNRSRTYPGIAAAMADQWGRG